MFYEIVHADGSIDMMSLAYECDPQAEVDKWSSEKRSTVVEIRKVDAHKPRPEPKLERAPVLLDANQIATPASENTSDVECTVAELAELKVNRAIATDARAPNEETGKGTGMLVFCVNGVWKTSVGTPVST